MSWNPIRGFGRRRDLEDVITRHEKRILRLAAAGDRLNGAEEDL